MAADPPRPEASGGRRPAALRPPAPGGPGRGSLALGLALVVVLAFGAGVAADRTGLFGAAPTSGPAASAEPGATLPPDATVGPGASVPPDAPGDIGLLWGALGIVREHYVDRSALVPASNLTYGMLDGLVRALGDPGHSAFMTPEQVKASQEDLSGSFSGIGAYLGERGGGATTGAGLSGSPARGRPAP